MIPTNRLNAVALKVQDQYLPLPNLGAPGSLVNNFAWVHPYPGDQYHADVFATRARRDQAGTIGAGVEVPESIEDFYIPGTIGPHPVRGDQLGNRFALFLPSAEARGGIELTPSGSVPLSEHGFISSPRITS